MQFKSLFLAVTALFFAGEIMAIAKDPGMKPTDRVKDQI